MPKCPQCDRPMVLERIPQGRVYQCHDYRCKYQHGEVLDPNQALTLQAISEDMLLKRQVDAQPAAARQMFFLQLADQLEAFPEVRQYLSDP
jgi:ssDNA-binding Zn-finger/Zn-ribbon topoisomerase 1